MSDTAREPRHALTGWSEHATMSAILFGSVSTLADTSELQRRAFNEAFAAHDLDWAWDRDDYRAMLERSGGRSRIAAYAEERGQSVDADAVHRTKTEIYQRLLAETPPDPRPGVVATVADARRAGIAVGLVTTTAAQSVSTLLDALGPDLGRDAFDIVVDTTKVSRPKPDPEAYVLALDTLGEEPAGCVAIEDNVGGVQAATAAGLRAVAFPNANTVGHTFDGAEHRVDAIDLGDLRPLLRA